MFLTGPHLNELEEDVARLEHAGGVGEHAEHDTHEEPRQIVAPVSGIGERVVQPPDRRRGFFVRRTPITRGPAMYAEDEAERLDIRGQVRESEGDRLALVQIVELEGLEILTGM